MIHKNWAELIKPTQLVVKPGADVAQPGFVQRQRHVSSGNGPA